MKPQGVIFDLDGTLLDSMPIWHSISGDYLRNLGLLPAIDLRANLKTKSLLQSAQFLREQYQLPYSDEEIMQQINAMLENQYRDHIPAKPHVAQFLQRLQKAGSKMCIATATDRYLVEAALERLGLATYFSFIVTCSEVGCGKDQAVIFHQALDLLHTPLAETIVFEDALYAIKTAKAAGFTVIGVYDSSAQDDAEAIQALADGYIYSYDEWEVD